MTTYKETIEFLYSQVPVFQSQGASAYKPGLQNAEALDAYFGHQHRRFRTIHVGGTNGKGSISSQLAAILQLAGYRVGLYTSPHIKDFAERIRIDGEMIDHDYVIDWVARHFDNVRHIEPSFFELTTMMAFSYFADHEVDVAIIEVGLGGRLDTTNIITPDLCIISNISLDHVQLLGSSLEQIAFEKAGIIKAGIPAVVGEAEGTVREVFEQRGHEVGTEVLFAEDDDALIDARQNFESERWEYRTRDFGSFAGSLFGDCQVKNTRTILTALPLLQRMGYRISREAVAEGFERGAELTHLFGRWSIVADKPKTIIDTGHNEAGLRNVFGQLARYSYGGRLRIVVGFVSDKDVDHIIPLMPREARYYFAQASVQRAYPVDLLAQRCREAGLQGEGYGSVREAYDAARADASADDLIFIGGSNFVIGDLMTSF